MKTLKLTTYILTIGLFIGSYSVNAQGKSQDKDKDKIEKTHDKAHEKADKAIQKGHEKADKTLDKAHDKLEKSNQKIDKRDEKSNNGNAYGKNKGNLSGREFGQQRAAEARNKLAAFEEDIKAKEILLIDGRRKVADARIRLEKGKQDKSISIGEAVKREEKIRIADEKLNNLEAVIARSKKTQEEESNRLVELARRFEKN